MNRISSFKALLIVIIAGSISGCLNTKSHFYEWNSEAVFPNRTMLYSELYGEYIWLFRRGKEYAVAIGNDDHLIRTVYHSENIDGKIIYVSQSLAGFITDGVTYNIFEVKTSTFGRDSIVAYSLKKEDFVRLANEFMIGHIPGNELEPKDKAQLFEMVRVIVNDKSVSKSVYDIYDLTDASDFQRAKLKVGRIIEKW